jgi:hypothetical protein
MPRIDPATATITWEDGSTLPLGLSVTGALKPPINPLKEFGRTLGTTAGQQTFFAVHPGAVVHPAAGPVPIAPVKIVGSPIFEEEFNEASAFVWGTNFSPSRGGLNGRWRMNGVVADPNNVSVQGGQAVLTSSSPTDGAMISSMPSDGASPGFMLNVGEMVEARVLVPDNGWWALWLCAEQWPQGGELDGLEFYNPGSASTNYHSGGPGHGSNDQANNDPSPQGGWLGKDIVVSMERLANVANVYWDGVLHRSVPTTDTGAPWGLMFNNGSNGTVGDKGYLDWVRAWKVAA